MTIIATARGWRRLLPAACTALVLGAPALAQDTTAASTPVVVECRLGDVDAVVIEGHARNGALVLPVRPLLALVGLDSTRTSGERDIAALRALLHADVLFDSTALVVQIADSGVLPASRRVARARARARLAEERATFRVPPRTPSVRTIPSGASVAYRVQRDGAASLAATALAFGGVMELTASRAVARGTRVRMRPGVRWLSIPWRTLRGARVGIERSDEQRRGTVVMLSNAPLERVDTVGTAALLRAVLPGAELQLFEDEVLVDADSVADRADARLALVERRGVHRVRLVESDPNGRERIVQWTEYVPDALLAAGSFRYSLSSRACWRVMCGVRAADVAYAPTGRVTFGALLVPSDVAAPRSTTSEWTAWLTARLSSATAVSFRTSPTGAIDGELRVERGRGESLVLRSGDVVSAPALVAIPSLAALSSRITTASGEWRAGSLSTVGFVAGRAGPHAVVATNASAAAAIGAVRAGVSLVSGATRCAHVFASALLWGAVLPRTLAAVRSAALDLRADRSSVGCGAPSSGGIALLLPALRWSALELSASWEHARGARRRVQVSVALRRRLGEFFDADAQLSGGAGGESVRSGVSGAVVVDALARSVAPVRGGDATASVHGVVFADGNANGRRDAGESVVAGALVRIAEANAVTDDRGIFVVRGLATDRAVRVGVDSASVEDLGLVPGPERSALLVSSAVVRIDVPLRRLPVPPS